MRKKRAERARFEWAAAVWAALLLSTAGCLAETDKDLYTAGEPGTATFANPFQPPLHLAGCAPFVFERSLGGVWVDLGPPFVCVWEGIAVSVSQGEQVETPFVAPNDTGIYRHRYDFGVRCEPGLPLSEADCQLESTTYSDVFEVERELCDPSEFGCRFVPGAPNFWCEDGVHVGGPSGECTRDPSGGQCGYEFLDCP